MNKIAKINKEYYIASNHYLIDLGYGLEIACTIGELKETIKNIPDDALVYIVSDVQLNRKIEDMSSIFAIEAEIETDEQYKERIDKIIESDRLRNIEQDKIDKEKKIQQYNRLKKELGY